MGPIVGAAIENVTKKLSSEFVIDKQTLHLLERLRKSNGGRLKLWEKGGHSRLTLDTPAKHYEVRTHENSSKQDGRPSLYKLEIGATSKKSGKQKKTVLSLFENAAQTKTTHFNDLPAQKTTLSPSEDVIATLRRRQWDDWKALTVPIALAQTEIASLTTQSGHDMALDLFRQIDVLLSMEKPIFPKGRPEERAIKEGENIVTATFPKSGARLRVVVQSVLSDEVEVAISLERKNGQTHFLKRRFKRPSVIVGRTPASANDGKKRGLTIETEPAAEEGRLAVTESKTTTSKPHRLANHGVGHEMFSKNPLAEQVIEQTYLGSTLELTEEAAQRIELPPSFSRQIRVLGFRLAGRDGLSDLSGVYFWTEYGELPIHDFVPIPQKQALLENAITGDKKHQEELRDHAWTRDLLTARMNSLESEINASWSDEPALALEKLDELKQLFLSFHEKQHTKPEPQFLKYFEIWRRALKERMDHGGVWHSDNKDWR